jgi:trehalose-6-phosphate synthase
MAGTEHDQLPSPAPFSDPLGQLQRLVIVSNRLPVTCVKQTPEEGGGWSFQKSSGGLVTALSGIKNTARFVWIGWPGVYVDNKEERMEMERKLFEEYSCIPVWMNFELMDDYYNGTP